MILLVMKHKKGAALANKRRGRRTPCWITLTKYDIEQFVKTPRRAERESLNSPFNHSTDMVIHRSASEEPPATLPRDPSKPQESTASFLAYLWPSCKAGCS